MTENAEKGKSEEVVVTPLEQKLAQMGEVSSGEPTVPSEAQGSESKPVTTGTEPGKDATPGADKPNQPAVASEDGKAPVVDDDIPNIPEGTNPNSENWKKLRDKAGSLKDEVKREREQRIALEQKLVEVQKAPAAPAKSTPEEIPAETVFTLLTGAKAGQFGEDKNNKQVLADANLLINNMPSNKILAVLRKAEANQLGEDSADVAIAAKEALVVALARERESDGVQLEREQQTNDYKTKLADSLKEAATKYPEMVKPGTEMEKFVSNFAEKMLGKMVNGKLQRGPLSHMMTDPTYPVAFAELAHSAFLASTVKGLQAQVEELTKKLNSGRTPQPPGGSAGAGSGGGQSETERQLAGMGNITQV